MASPEHLEMLKKGPFFWNRFRREQADATDFRPDLSEAKLTDVSLFGADLSRACLRGADLSNANLRQADLRDTDLRNANLVNADLTAAAMNKADVSGANAAGATLAGAHLARAILTGANLSRTNLTDAILTRANLAGANLKDANLEHANVGYTIFGSNDLSAVRGLMHVNHHGPSTIGIDTIYASKGDIPEHFLRGAGVPEAFIQYVRSIVGEPIEFYSCFISYSTRDQDFVQRLHADLQDKGVRCWFAPHDAQAGRKLHEQIDHAIRLHDKLLLVLSEDSMNSDWVATEIAAARRREKAESRQMLFPIGLVSYDRIRGWECFDADTGQDSAREVRQYLIPDFTDWNNHDSYVKTFDRLLRDLKAKTVSASGQR